MGLGAYNAYQITKTRESVENNGKAIDLLGKQLTSGITDIERQLDQQASTLSILVEGGKELSDKIDMYHEEVKEGFKNTVALIKDENARKESEAFKEKMRAL